MACGENAKNFYGEKGIMPGSRLGEGYLFRKAFQSAKQTKENQDEWCTLAKQAYKQNGNNAYKMMQTEYPFSLENDALVSLLRNETKLQNHCYEVRNLIIKN